MGEEKKKKEEEKKALGSYIILYVSFPKFRSQVLPVPRGAKRDEKTYDEEKVSRGQLAMEHDPFLPAYISSAGHVLLFSHSPTTFMCL